MHRNGIVIRTGRLVALGVLMFNLVGCTSEKALVASEVMTDPQFEQIVAEGEDGTPSTLADIQAVAPKAVEESIKNSGVDVTAKNDVVNDGGQRDDGQQVQATAEGASYVIQCWSADHKVLYQFYMHGETVSKKERIEVPGD